METSTKIRSIKKGKKFKERAEGRMPDLSETLAGRRLIRGN